MATSLKAGQKWGDVDEEDDVAEKIGSLSVAPPAVAAGAADTTTPPIVPTSPTEASINNGDTNSNIPVMDFDPKSLGNPNDFVSKREVFTIDGQPSNESQKVHSWAVLSYIYIKPHSFFFSPYLFFYFSSQTYIYK